jgi:branched-subunit amino acid aminotransferase/4-amino-4-deoxychorismate lyase
VFLTNTVSGIAPVGDIDGWKIGDGKPGPYGERFQKTYMEWLDTGKDGTQVFPEAWE